jgi:hypothetical protein
LAQASQGSLLGGVNGFVMLPSPFHIAAGGTI